MDSERGQWGERGERVDGGEGAMLLGQRSNSHLSIPGRAHAPGRLLPYPPCVRHRTSLPRYVPPRAPSLPARPPTAASTGPPTGGPCLAPIKLPCRTSDAAVAIRWPSARRPCPPLRGPSPAPRPAAHRRHVARMSRDAPGVTPHSSATAALVARGRPRVRVSLIHHSQLQPLCRLHLDSPKTKRTHRSRSHETPDATIVGLRRKAHKRSQPPQTPRRDMRSDARY